MTKPKTIFIQVFEASGNGMVAVFDDLVGRNSPSVEQLEKDFNASVARARKILFGKRK